MMPVSPDAPLPALSDAAHQVLAVIGRLAPASFRPDVVAAAFHPPSTPRLWQRFRRQPSSINPETALQELQQAGLLRRESYRLIIGDDAVYQHARQLPVSEQAIQELIRTYEELALVNEAMTDDHRRQLDGERPHLLAILRLCQERKAWVPIRNIHISLRDYWSACENTTDQIEAYEARVAAAYGLGDQGEIARFSQKLGDAYYAAAAYDKALACYEQAAAHGTTTGWRGEILLRLGLAQMMHQQYQAALKTLSEANRIFLEMRKDKQLAKCLMYIAMIHAALAEPEKCEQHYTQAIRVASALNESELEAQIEHRLGQFYETSGQQEQAITHFNRSLWFYQRLNDRREQIALHTRLAALYDTALNQDASLHHYGEALLLAYDFEKPLLFIECSFNMGRAFYEDQQYRQAIIHFQEVVTMSLAQQEAEEWRLSGLSHLGSCAMYVGEYEAAEVYFQELLPLIPDGDQVFVAETLIDLARTGLRLGQWAEARQWLESAWEKVAETEEFSHQAVIRNSQGEWHRQQGQLEAAFDLYEQALQLAQKSADGLAANQIWQEKGFAHLAKGDVAAAISCFEQAITLARQQKDEFDEREACWNLGMVLAEHEPGKALALLWPRLHYYQKIEHSYADEDAAFVAEIEERLSL